jgi:hypothetical protein
MFQMDTYGQAKVACEQQVPHAFDLDRALIARVGSSAVGELTWGTDRRQRAA